MHEALTPRQHHPTDDDIVQIAKQILDLIRSSFAYMESRIDPPSSMHRLSAADIIKHCSDGEVWSINNPVKACLFLRLKPDVLYLGRLAVSCESRKRGLANSLITLAEQRAQLHKKTALEIETRIELIENHQFFHHRGFVKTADGTHPGYQQPTYVVMQKCLRHKA